jgi:hypothetical protein
MKVFKLEVVAHGETKYTKPVMPFIGYDVGMVFAGAVFPALMTHLAASMMLANLFPQLEGPQIRVPSFANVALLLCHLSSKYIREAAVAYNLDSPPLCEFVVFAQPPLLDLVGGPLSCCHIHPSFDANGTFTQVADEVDLAGGDVAAIGEDTGPLKESIRIGKAQDPEFLVNGPRIALEQRMRAGTHDKVGGTLQFGILRSGRITLYGSSRDIYGEPQHNWLGFDCQAEIRDIIGMPVVIPSCS